MINATTRAFLVFSLNLAKFLQSEANSIGVNDGGFLWLGTKMATYPHYSLLLS